MCAESKVSALLVRANSRYIDWPIGSLKRGSLWRCEFQEVHLSKIYLTLQQTVEYSNPAGRKLGESVLTKGVKRGSNSTKTANGAAARGHPDRDAV